MSAEDEWSGNCAFLRKGAPLSVAAPLGCTSNAGGSAEVDDSATSRPKTKRGKRANKHGQEAPEAPEANANMREMVDVLHAKWEQTQMQLVELNVTIVWMKVGIDRGTTYP